MIGQDAAKAALTAATHSGANALARKNVAAIVPAPARSGTAKLTIT